MLARYSALLVGVSACDAVLGFHRGTPAPAAEAGRGGRGSGGNGGGGGSSDCCADGGTSAGTAGRSTGSGGSSASSAGRGGAETLASGGSSEDGGKSGAPGAGTSGDAPVAGEGGHGGEAGGDTGPCRKNADCPNPDPDCRAECRSTAFGNTCVIVPADRDGDLHGSSACEGAAPPGDDCDDSRADVYKDAPELCDARDNDCDGKRDFDDGQTLTRASQVIASEPAYGVDVAWSPSQMTWGVVWDAASGTMYQPIDRAGAARIEPVRISDYVGSYGVGGPGAGDEPFRAVLPPIPATRTVAIAWGEDSLGTGAFAVAFPDGWLDVLLGLVTADGASLVPALPLTDAYGGFGGEAPDLQWLESQGVWAASWTDLRDMTFQPLVRSVSLSGAYGPEVQPGFGYDVGIALAGGQLAAVWQGFGKVRASLLSSSFEATAIDVAGELDLEYPFIAGQTDRFGLVFRALPDKYAYAEIGVDGAILCGPVLREANGLVHSDIMPFAEGFLILAGQPTVQAIEVLPGCRFGSTIQLASTPAHFVRGGNAPAEGVVIAWGGPDQPLEARVMGPHLCEH